VEIIGKTRFSTTQQEEGEQMVPDFPAAHSMDTEWFAIDQDGHVACFDSSTMGAVPAGQTQEDGYELRQRLRTQLPAAPVVFDLSGHLRPGRQTANHYRGRWYWPALCFLQSLDPVREQIAAGRAFEVRASGGLAVVLRRPDDGFLDRLHDSGVCLGCFNYDIDRDDLPLDSTDMPYFPARFGVYSYGHLWGDDVAGPYGREELPLRPIHVDELPPDLRQAVRRARFDRLCFAQTPHIQPAEWIPCDFFEPKAGYIASDGVTHKPRPRRRRK